METFLTLLDNNWPAVVSVATVFVGLFWAWFVHNSTLTANTIDDAIVRVIHNNPVVVDKIARKVEQTVADALFAPEPPREPTLDTTEIARLAQEAADAVLAEESDEVEIEVSGG